MHIPDHMLNGQICPVTAVVSAISVIGAAIAAFFSKNKPAAERFAAVTAFIFAAQMMNFPIKDGTSGHLLGAVIAVSLLGLPYGILAMSIVVCVQCLVFSDGGFTVLGANILNMAVVGAVTGGIINTVLIKRLPEMSFSRALALGAAAWTSIMAAVFACSAELGISGTISFSKVAGAMLSTHAVIGIGEALITVAACYAFNFQAVRTSDRLSAGVPVAAALVIAGTLSPFASGFPDGLEWVAAKYSFLHEAAPAFVGPLPDYTVPMITGEAFSTMLAGLIGAGVTFLVAWVSAKFILKPELQGARR